MKTKISRSLMLIGLIVGTGCSNDEKDSSPLSQAPASRPSFGISASGPDGQRVILQGRTPPNENLAPEHHPSQVIVKFKKGAQRRFLSGSGTSRLLAQDVHGQSDIAVIENPMGMSVQAAIDQYKRDANVAYAEPDYIVKAISIPNDPRYSEQWDMTKVAAPEAWSLSSSSENVVVAVIDTGIDYTHPELSPNLWSDPENPSVHGFSCFGGVVPGGADNVGHGTHVAGTIGAAGNNGVGIAGLNWRVQLLSLKFLNPGGGTTSDAINCFGKAISLKAQGFNLRVTNNSWGGGGPSLSLQNIMKDAENAGILNVVAAGNSYASSELYPHYPASYDNRGLISVMATDIQDEKATFSNYGSVSVDLAAPGVNILSTVPGGYDFYNGTSMATPHVAGVAAALFQANPNLTAFQARDLILDFGSYDSLSDVRARRSTTGGRLNFHKALISPRLPNPPLNQFPTLTGAASDVIANSGGLVNFNLVASDPDGDPTQFDFSAIPLHEAYYRTHSFIGVLFPTIFSFTPSFTAPSLAYPAAAIYETSVTDRRGGGAPGPQSKLAVRAKPSPGLPPTGIFNFPANSPIGVDVQLDFYPSDPEGGPVMKSFGWGWGPNQYVPSGSEEYVGASSPIVVRMRAWAVDSEFRVMESNDIVARFGGASGTPPIAIQTLDKVSGTAPLSVTVNGASSYDPDGSIARSFITCFPSDIPAHPGPQHVCTYNQPGIYEVALFVEDNQSLADARVQFVRVLPPGIDDPSEPGPPTVSITSPLNGAVVSGSVTVSANASDDAGVVGVQFKLDGNNLNPEDLSSPYSTIWNSTTASNGPHVLTAVARDAEGNSTTSNSVNVTVDNPIIPDPARSTVNGSVILTGTKGGLPDPAGSITMTIRDAFSNPIPNIAVNLDLSACNYVSICPSPNFNPVTKIFSGTTDAAGMITLKIAGSALLPQAESNGGACARLRAGGVLFPTPLYVSVMDLNGSGEDPISRVAVDGNDLSTILWDQLSFPGRPRSDFNGNGGVDGDDLSIWLGRFLEGAVSGCGSMGDNLPPVISGVSASSIGQNSATISWNTNEASDSQVEYGLNTSYGSSTTLNPSMVTSHSQGLTGLASSTLYHYRVKSKDAAGNLATSIDYTFTTLAPVDLIPPVVSMTSPANGSTVSGTLPVSANASDNVGVVGVQFRLDGSNLGAEDFSSPYSISWDTTTASNGSHVLTAVARDAAGNSKVSTPITVTVDNSSPPTPGNAAYSSAYKAPFCASGGNSCDSGPDLLNGRGPFENNSPNTIGNSCADGSQGSHHVDESIDRLKISVVGGGNFAPGKTVRIDATIWASIGGHEDWLDIYSAADASAPSWVYRTTLPVPTTGSQVMSTTFTLPAGNVQVIRGHIIRHQGPYNFPCNTGPYEDNDDLVFTVGSPSPPAANTSATDGSVISNGAISTEPFQTVIRSGM